eukprot:TRINITY_DN25652_c0_g1_i1.p1 TRINITY_DN25652_c0_g1~~TRINITY_DN25652_c0_g1_i1.p1  ORF type:complete len:287 (+),score=84.76 TRINITY_DN25652_c0_g1_i1:77-937(+)
MASAAAQDPVARAVQSDEQAVEFLNQMMRVGIDHLLPGGTAESKREALLQARRTHMLKTAVKGTAEVRLAHHTVGRAAALEGNEMEERGLIASMQAEAFMLIGADWTATRCAQQREEAAARRRGYLREPLPQDPGVPLHPLARDMDVVSGAGSPVHDHFMPSPRQRRELPQAYASSDSDDVLYGGVSRPLTYGGKLHTPRHNTSAHYLAGSSSPTRAQERLQQHFSVFTHPPPVHHPTPQPPHTSPRFPKSPRTPKHAAHAAASMPATPGQTVGGRTPQRAARWRS